jgi:hypothetical protein
MHFGQIVTACPGRLAFADSDASCGTRRLLSCALAFGLTTE